MALRQRRPGEAESGAASADLEDADGDAKRSGGSGGSDAPACSADAAGAGIDLTGDRGHLALLLLLYTLQGVPMGLANSVTFVMQERGASMAAQAVFSFVSWPFSLKILWAPLVDTCYLRSVGQRRTWLLPVQTLVGVLMLCLGPRVEALLSPAGGGPPEARPLAVLFFWLYVLMATQDIAVDGWALTLLSRRNVGLASTANAVGQTVGYFAAFSGYLALSEHGVTTLAGFMRAWGLLFLASAVAVALTREAPAEGASAGVADVYAHAWRLLRLRSVRTLLAVLLSCRVAFAATDGLATLTLIKRGVSKAHMAYLSTAIAPLHIALPLLLARWTSGDSPWAAFLAAYPPRLAVGLAVAALVASAPPPGAPRGAFYAGTTAVMAAQACLSQLQFVAQMAFFARVADPAIGGTAMTLLNTVANLGAKWPNSVVMFAADALQRRQRARAGEHPPADDVGAFGLLTLACTAVGLAWIGLMRRKVVAMGALPDAAWLAAPPRP